MATFDPDQAQILIWQPPLPPETTMLIPTDPAAEQVDLRAPAPPGDPACWLTEEYFEGAQSSVVPEHAQPTDVPTSQHTRIHDGDRPDGVHPAVKTLANLIAVNAVLEAMREPCRKEEPASTPPKKED